MTPKSLAVLMLFLVSLSGQAGSFNIGIYGIPATLSSAGLNLVVDSPLDLSDANPGDGYCSTAMGTCTLRAAIEETNAYPGADSITLPADTYVLSSSLLVTDELSVFGEDRDTTIIDANGADTALKDFGGLTLDSVTVRGSTQAGIDVVVGTLSLISSRVRDNSGLGIRCGDWLYRPELSILNTEVLENGSGISVNDCSARIVGSSISRNNGFGVDVTEGDCCADATLEDSYVGENLGGGLRSYGLAGISLQSTTVANNTAANGAGFYSDGCSILLAVNSTFSGNRATGHGGGIFLPPNYCFIGFGSSLVHTTIAENVADSDGDGVGDGGGIFSADHPNWGDGLTTIKGTILAGNEDLSGEAPDCGGPEDLVSEGFNLIGDTTGCSFVGETSTNITDVEPVMGPLADNGGMTPTHQPLVLSPAIDVIPPGDCSVATDQRGVSRPQGPGCDIGSVEVGLFCEGFEPPMARGPVVVRGRRVLPFKAQLFSGEGQLVTDFDLTAPPHIQIWYRLGTPDAEDVSAKARSTGQRTRGRRFFFDANERWHYNLATRVYSEPGTYTVFMVSGDETEYFLEPSCRAQFIILGACRGDLLATNQFTDSILCFDGQTGAFIGAFVPTGSGGLDAPYDLVLGPDNELYVTALATDSVLRYDGRTGAFIDVFVPAASGGLDLPTGLTFGPDGDLYVTSRNNGLVLRYDGLTGGFIDTFVSSFAGGMSVAGDILFGPDGNLLLASFGNDQVLRYHGQTGAFIDAFVPAASGGLDGPVRLTFGPDANLYVASQNTDSVLRYDGQTGAFIDAFVPTGSGGLGTPSGLVFGPDGDLYVGGWYPPQVLRYDGQSGFFVDTFVAPGSGGLNSPQALVFEFVP